MHSMKLFIVLFTISTVLISVSDSLFILGGLILIKAAIIKGLIIGGLIGAAVSRGGGRGGGREGGRGRGGHGRGKRSIDEAAIEPILAVASQRDVDDCGKKLICSLSSRDATTLAEDEALILSLFGRGDLDVSKSTVEFDLAAKMGQKVGIAHCNTVYSRCAYNVEQLMEVMRQPENGNRI